MKLRLYNALSDYVFLQNWINDERIHALWCANLIPYPMTSENLQEVLEKDALDWGGCAYVAIEDDGNPFGFFVLSVNELNNSAFLKFIIVDRERRGKGYGAQMMELALTHAFDVVGVTSVQLNVFDVNHVAKKCYTKAGFVVDNITEDAFKFENESWGRCHMEIAKRF